MKRALVAMAAVLTLSSATASVAQKVVQEADKTVYKKKTVIDFNDVTLEGELTKPEGTYALSKKQTKFKSLIKVRDNFVPELQKSVDNL